MAAPALKEKTIARISGILHITILILSLFLIISISLDTFKGTAFYTQSSYLKVQFWICLWFLLDFFIEFFLAEKKLYYLKTHFIFLLVSIPYQSIIAHYGWTFSPEATYFIRFIPLVRGGYALALVVGWLTDNKASSLFVSYLTMLLATVYFSSLAFFVLEHPVNHSVTTYSDALWWAFMDVTTVGSNIIAVTVTGRILSVLLAAMGMMMFPIFTVYVTSIVTKKNKERRESLTQAGKGATISVSAPETASTTASARTQAPVPTPAPGTGTTAATTSATPASAPDPKTGA